MSKTKNHFKGYVLKKINQNLDLMEYKLNGDLLYGQVLVKILFTGLCGKQIEEFNGKMGKDIFLPHLLGHEASGIVKKKHKSVKNVKIGDRVVLHWVKSSKGIQSKPPKLIFKKNKKLNAGWITTFNNYSIVSSNRLTKIPKKSDMKIAALLGCCLSTGIGTIFNQSKPQISDTCAVIGCGGVGLSTIIGLKMAKVKNIFAFDINNINLNKALKLGATRKIIISKKSNLNKNIDKIFISTGNVNAIKFAQKIATKNTTLYFMGVPAPKSIINIDALSIHKGQNYVSSSGGEVKPERDINRYLKMCKLHNKTVKKIIIKTYNYKKLPEVLHKMSKGTFSHGRNLFDFSNC